MSEPCPHCAERSAHHDQSFKKDLTSRLNRIEGQIRGITRMVGDDVYCDEVLNQINSAASALHGVRKLLLAAHIKSCVADQLKEGRTEVVDELMLTLDKMIAR